MSGFKPATHSHSGTANLKQQLDRAYQRPANNLPNNAAVRIELAKGRQRLTISNLDKLAEPESYLQLKEQVEALAPG
ncbi:hypothetical protein Q5692_26830 [Microcoleus sp. C2C3]|uniref:hypothetical protein n=1 Tax=unclassified Microcoleus TaxID=2642155 RepID=UPI002FD66F34